MKQRNKTQIGKLLFPPVGYGNLGGTLQCHIPLIGFKGMHRQSLNKAAAFNTTNGGTPMVFGKGIGQPCA